MAKKIDDLLKKKAEDPKAAKLAKIAGICSNIKKKFGEESVNFLGNSKAEAMPRISTGSIALDKITGGGFPEGRIIEVFGGESSGKCLTKDTRIQTANGYKRLEDIFNENGITPYCTQKEVPFSYPLVNMNGEIENTTHFVMNGKRTVFRTETQHGAVIHSTAKHPLRVLSKNGFPIWKLTCELEPGDVLIGRKGDGHFAKSDVISETEATLLGLLIADGHFAEQRVGMTNSDPEILDYYRDHIGDVQEFAGMKPLEYKLKERTATEMHVTSKERVAKFYKRMGFRHCIAKEKSVPSCVLNGSKAIQRAFLNAYVDCECNFNDTSIEISSASCELLSAIRLMLLNFGIESYLSSRKVKGYEQNDYWRLCIYSSDITKYINEIGFFTSARKEAASKYAGRNWMGDKIPNINWLVDEYYDSVDPAARCREALKGIHKGDDREIKYTSDVIIRFLEKTAGYGSEHLEMSLRDLTDEHLVFDKVVSVEKQNDVETFDFAMERTHSFIAEGIINHNTTVCYHIISEFQKKYPDGLCAFVDEEGTFDPVYAAAIGVNVGELITSQPDSGEDAFGMVQALIENGVKLVVVDSVAAMLPKDEAASEEYGQTGVALQARLMSQGLRKLNPFLNKFKATLVFTNQTRTNIKVMYGDPQCVSVDTMVEVEFE